MPLTLRPTYNQPYEIVSDVTFIVFTANLKMESCDWLVHESVTEKFNISCTFWVEKNNNVYLMDISTNVGE